MKPPVIDELPGYEVSVQISFSSYADGIWRTIQMGEFDVKWRWKVTADYYNAEGRELNEEGESDSPQEAAEIIESEIGRWKAKR